MADNYRKIVYQSLLDIIYNKQFSHLYLQKLFDDNDIDVKNKSIIRREVFGILENRILIDYVISKYSKSKNIDKKIKLVLYIGIYELLFLNNTKNYATVNECVELAKNIKGQFLSKFVNAILKNIDKNENLQNLYNDKNLTDDIKYSIPKDLYNYLLNNLNVEVDNKKQVIKEIFEYFIDNNKICFRINTKDEDIIKEIENELRDLNIEYEKYNSDLKLINYISYLSNNINDLSSINNFKNGNISIEDIASIYYIDNLYEIYKNILIDGSMILDACSSPGGKTTAIHHLIDNNTVKYFCHDVSDKKLIRIKENIDREFSEADKKNIQISVKDGTRLDKNYIDKFDLVMTDVPCSGLGTISKKPDIKYNFDINKIDELISLQKSILDTNKNYVKINGLLSYSTCTITKNENIDIINEFLKNNDNFILIKSEQIIPSINTKSDGFFFAIMKRIK